MTAPLRAEANQLRFLREIERIEARGLRATRKHLSLADRVEDRNRQSCRRAGWVEWSGFWALTDAGRALLSETPDE